MTCDDVRTARVLGGALDDAATAHARACPRCREEAAVADALAQALAAWTVPAPPPGLAARVLCRAAPELARHARRVARPDWRSIARALVAGLSVLPLVLFVDAQLVRGAYALLSLVLPGPLSAYLVGTWVALLAFALAVTYAAVPFVAARQAAVATEERHA
jgi:hypothetical protein